MINIDFTGSQSADVNDNLGEAHIHASATGDPWARTRPVVWGFSARPFNDNDPNDVVVMPFATASAAPSAASGTAAEGNNTTLKEQLPNILAGHSYINFHTTQFPGGEVRGADRQPRCRSRRPMR